MFEKNINIEHVSFLLKFDVIFFKKSSYLDLSIQSYEFLNFKLQNNINDKTKKKDKN